MPASKSSDSHRQRRSSSRHPSKRKSNDDSRLDSGASGAAAQTLEDRIDSPKLQTLVLLCIVAVLTVILWGSAKLACNSQTASARPPLRLSSTELATNPKDAAFELEQRWAMHDFARVRALAKGAVLAELDAAARRCAEDRKCENAREELEARVKSTASLLSKTPTTAKVRVKTIGGEGGPQTYLLELVEEGGIWKVISRQRD
jgi:hypothetical protein